MMGASFLSFTFFKFSHYFKINSNPALPSSKNHPGIAHLFLLPISRKSWDGILVHVPPIRPTVRHPHFRQAIWVLRYETCARSFTKSETFDMYVHQSSNWIVFLLLSLLCVTLTLSKRGMLPLGLATAATVAVVCLGLPVFAVTLGIMLIAWKAY